MYSFIFFHLFRMINSIMQKHSFCLRSALFWKVKSILLQLYLYGQIYNIASDLDDKRKIIPHILSIHVNMLRISFYITLRNTFNVLFLHGETILITKEPFLCIHEVIGMNASNSLIMTESCTLPFQNVPFAHFSLVT